jgi:hypothetical protein
MSVVSNGGRSYESLTLLRRQGVHRQTRIQEFGDSSSHTAMAYIDIRSVPSLIRDEFPDPEVLGLAAKLGRVLLTHDVSTMPNTSKSKWRTVNRRE